MMQADGSYVQLRPGADEGPAALGTHRALMAITQPGGADLQEPRRIAPGVPAAT